LTLSPISLCRILSFQTLIDGSYDSTRGATFLGELLKHLRGNVIVVWDNGPMHKGPAIPQLLKRNPRLTLKWLPPDAPELNPVEQHWSHLKFGHCANFIPRNLDCLDDEATDFLADTRFNSKTLQSY
jgi:putative transposase